MPCALKKVVSCNHEALKAYGKRFCVIVNQLLDNQPEMSANGHNQNVFGRRKEKRATKP